VVNRLCSPAVSRRALVGFAAGAAGTASALVPALGHRVPAVLPGRGGRGDARIVPHLTVDAIRRNPKALTGYSDRRAPSLAGHACSGRRVTLPIGAGVDRDATARSILMLGAAVR
jgi:hypothetical protein